MQNPLQFAGVPQTVKASSAANGLKFTILWEHVEEILLFNTFFRSSIHALVAKTQPEKVAWCADDEFWTIFASYIFQRAACSTFHTCILNLH